MILRSTKTNYKDSKRNSNAISPEDLPSKVMKDENQQKKVKQVNKGKKKTEIVRKKPSEPLEESKDIPEEKKNESIAQFKLDNDQGLKKFGAPKINLQLYLSKGKAAFISSEKNISNSSSIPRLPDANNQQNFEFLIESNSIYVDKTNILYKLLAFPNAVVITGPRRCGKTLTLSTIEAIFSQTPEWWRKNCSDLYIFKQHSDFFDKNPHPIMNFNFFGVNSLKGFHDKIRIGLNYAISSNQITYEKIPKNVSEEVINDHLFDVTLALIDKFKNTPIVLIDESDNPLLNVMQDYNLSKDEKKKKMESLLQSYKTFYGNLKDLLVRNLRGIVICGHSMISQTAIYSGFNNGIFLRNEVDKSCHELLGFTENEIEFWFKDEIEKVMVKKTYSLKEEVMTELKKHYNGFNMNPYSENSLFNPFSIQKYFRKEGKLENYFANSGGTEILFKLLKTQSYERLTEFLTHILNEKQMIPIDIQEFINAKNWEVFQNDFYQIALDAGHLTFGKIGNQYFLKVPNEEMRENFSSLINTFFFKNANYNSLYTTLVSLDFENFFKTLDTIVFQNGSIMNLKDRIIEGIDQANYEIFLHQACSIAVKEMLIYLKKTLKISEYQFENEKVMTGSNGKTKLYLFFSLIDRIKDELFQFLIEFKIVTNKKGTKISDKITENEIAQIFQNEYYQIFEKKGSNCYIIGVGFNPFCEEETISEILVKKFEGKSYDFGKTENWMIKYCKKKP